MLLKPIFSIKVQYAIALLALYFATILNLPVLSEIFKLSEDVQSFWFPFSAPILLFSIFLLLFTALSIPYLFKPIIILITLSSAAASYAVSHYGILLGMDMMENVFETNQSEISTYLNASSITYFIFAGILPSLLITLVKIQHGQGILKSLKPRVLTALIGILGITLVLATNYKNYASVGRNNHYLGNMIIPAHIFNAIKYVNKTYLTTPLPYVSLGDDAAIVSTSNNTKPTLVVMVLGETARAQNYAYNGYDRDTNPYTRERNVISLGSVTTCGTHTALSVPCMFSDLTRANYDKAEAQARDNVVDIIAKAGVKTLWIENDGGDKGIAKHHAKIELTKSGSPFCMDGYCYDEGLIAPMKQFIENDTQDKFIVLHAMGSHGPTYWQRYPDDMATFKPSCNKSDIENCSDEEIRNVYDNSILYTDYVIAKIIDELKAYQDTYNVALTYMSDHGESLGENGLYLHGTPYAIAPDEQTHVPWLFWLPEQYAEQKHIDKHCLAESAQKAQLSQDNLFHSLLGLYGIKTSIKSDKLDIFQQCTH